MTRAGTLRMFFVSLCVFSSGTALRADVFAETIQNVALTFTSSAGSVVFLSPNDAAAFGMVADSFGGTGQQLETGKGAVTVNVNTPDVFVNFTSVGGASAIGSANALTLKSDNLAVAELFLVGGTATATATSTLNGRFEITGTDLPASLNVSAALGIAENFAETDQAGISGSAEARFSVLLNSGDKPVAFDSLVEAGSDQQKGFNNLSETLTGSAILQPNTEYSFTAEEFSMATASNSATLPEPSSYLLASIILLSGMIAWRQTRPGIRNRDSNR